jgi:acyl-CoA reductase-like NAD-dependent aldehyde dehydrogenase
MQPRVTALRCGPSLSSAPGKAHGPIETVDCGSMISSRLFDDLESILSSAEKQGARILAGGKRLDHPVWKSGHYFQPTLIVDVTTDMDIARNELFAPVMTVMPYDTIEEAVAIANSTRYGLGSAVFGNDRTECRQVAAAMKTGMVAVNECVYDRRSAKTFLTLFACVSALACSI